MTLAALPLRRLLQSLRAWLSVGGWSAVCVFVALWLHRGGADAPSSSALLGVFSSLALPLVAFAITGAVFKGDSLRAACRPLVTFGAPGPLVALAHAAVAILASALVGAVLSALVDALAHGPSDPALGRDALTCAWVGVLGGAAYGSLFSLGSAIGSKGGGRGGLLVANWIFSAGATASLFPHAHVRSLLGGESAGNLGQRGSALALLVIVAFGLAACAMRGRNASAV